MNLDTTRFINNYFSFNKEIEEDFLLIEKMNNHFYEIGVSGGWQANSGGGAPCLMDLYFIYMMTRIVKPKNAIEIGSWSGLSAHVISLAISRDREDFVVDTCDWHNYMQKPAEYSSFNNNIIFHCCHSNMIYKKIKNEKRDFVFNDAQINKTDVKNLTSDKDNLFFMTHDVYPSEFQGNDKKGNSAITAIKKAFGTEDYYTFYPTELDVGYRFNKYHINSCTGFIAGKAAMNNIVNNQENNNQRRAV